MNAFLTTRQLQEIAARTLPCSYVWAETEGGYDIGSDFGWAASIHVGPPDRVCYLMTVELLLSPDDLAQTLRESWIRQVIEPLNEAYLLEHSG